MGEAVCKDQDRAGRCPVQVPVHAAETDEEVSYRVSDDG
jgi:hypothetical protein